MSIDKYNKKINDLKNKIFLLKTMRPGSLNRFFPDKEDKTKFYYQVNFTHRGKTHTQYIRPELVPQIKKELSEYKKFKGYIDEITHYCLLESKERIKEKRMSLKAR